MSAFLVRMMMHGLPVLHLLMAWHVLECLNLIFRDGGVSSVNVKYVKYVRMVLPSMVMRVNKPNGM